MKYILIILLLLVACDQKSEERYSCNINHIFHDYIIDNDQKLAFGTDLPSSGVEVKNTTNSITFKQEDGRMVVIQKYDMISHIHGMGYSVDGTCKKIK